MTINPPLSSFELFVFGLFVALSIFAIGLGARQDYQLARESSAISQRPIFVALLFMSICRILSFLTFGALLLASRAQTDSWFLASVAMWVFPFVNGWVLRRAFRLMAVAKDIEILRSERQEEAQRKMRADDLRRLNEERDFVRNIVKQAYSR